MKKKFEIQFRKLFRKTPQALLACSGGVDSMVLLDLLRGLYEKSEPKPLLRVAYIDHGQRDDTDKDIRLVQTYCEDHGLHFVARELKTSPGASEQKLRDARYGALAKLAAGDVVFTAHHAQDQLETYLFRLIRGAHPDTLAAISPRTQRQTTGGTLRLARPLLFADKEQLLTHARERRLLWREDSTNRSSRFARNRIRHELLPLLEDLRPGTAARALAFFEVLCQKNTKGQSKAPELKKLLSSTTGTPVQQIDFRRLKTALDSLLGQHSHRTTRSHWLNVQKQLHARLATQKGGGPRKVLQFPGGHAVEFKGNRVFFRRNPAES